MSMMKFDIWNNYKYSKGVVNTLLFDFSRTLIFPKDRAYKGKLNELYKSIILNKNYKFFDHFILNNDLINYLKPFKNKFLLAIFTTDIIQNDPAVRPVLDENFSYVFVANDLKVSKKDPKAYHLIAKTLGRKTSDIIYVDDTVEKLQAAKGAGMKTVQFISNKQLFKELEKKL